MLIKQHSLGSEPDHLATAIKHFGKVSIPQAKKRRKQDAQRAQSVYSATNMRGSNAQSRRKNSK